MNFSSEREMSESIRDLFEDILYEDNFFFKEEIKGVTGIPDYIIYEKNSNTVNYIISIELKLKNWKQALKQAFRYRNFSNESFVILDEDSIELVKKNMDYFKRFNIGLGSFNNKSELKIYYYPNSSKPYSLHYIEKAINKIAKIKENNDKETEIEYLLREDSILPKKLIEMCSFNHIPSNAV